jgi:cell division protein FtsQ
MFGFLKRGNRRKEKAAQTVSVKARKTRSAGVRFATALLGFSLSVTALALLGWKGVQFALDAAVYRNPQLAIDHIIVETDGSLLPERIREWARVKNGDNLLALDLNRVKRDLELRAVIESAAIEKLLPRTLRITVVERKPVALVYLFRNGDSGAGQFDYTLLDANGVVVPPMPPGVRKEGAADPASLPVLTGFNPRELRPGVSVSSPQIRAALQLIRALGHSPLVSMVEIKSIDLSSASTLAVKTGEGCEVTLACDDFERQLARWKVAIEFGRRYNRILASIDLAVGNYVPATWTETTLINAPPTAPAPATLPPRRTENSPRIRKHV